MRCEVLLAPLQARLSLDSIVSRVEVPCQIHVSDPVDICPICHDERHRAAPVRRRLR